MEQKGGLGSRNSQIGMMIVNQGASYEDIKAMVADMFKANMLEYKDEAAKLVAERGDKIRDEIFEAIRNDQASNPEKFKQPDVQDTLFQAQKSYAITGDDDLKDLLISSVVNLTKEPVRNLRSIALQEAVKTLPIITLNQAKILSVIFSFRYVAFTEVSGLADINVALEDFLGKIIDGIKLDAHEYRHLEYAGCGTSTITDANLHYVIQQTYPNFPESKLSAADFDLKMIQMGGVLKKINDLSNGGQLGRFTLSSVGIAIGHSYVKSVSNSLSDLSVFLS